MTIPTLDLDARGIARLCAYGWKAFLITLIGGGIVTAVSVLKVEPHTYKREIVVNLATPQADKRNQQQTAPRPPACDIALGLRSDNDALPQFERDVYTEVIQKHRFGELGVTEFRIFERGALAFKVSVTINQKQDPRIARLIQDFNDARSNLVQILQQRIKESEQQSQLLASSIDWVGAVKEEEAATQLSSFLREELECTNYELQILQTRLQNSSAPIPYPKVLDDLMAASPIKTLITCLFATFLAAFLAALLTGYIRLSKELAEKPDVADGIKY